MAGTFRRQLEMGKQYGRCVTCTRAQYRNPPYISPQSSDQLHSWALVKMGNRWQILKQWGSPWRSQGAIQGEQVLYFCSRAVFLNSKGRRWWRVRSRRTACHCPCTCKHMLGWWFLTNFSPSLPHTSHPLFIDPVQIVDIKQVGPPLLLAIFNTLRD